jgi:hypothetical protein
MSNKTTDVIQALLVSGHSHDPVLKREVEDAMWADFGRRVHQNVINENLVKAVNRAGMGSKPVLEMVAKLRAYILTGTLP